MSRPLVLLDLTRLFSAAGRSAPTGIERVEYAYARWLLGHSSVHARFVVTLNSSVRLVADNQVPTFLDRQQRTWAAGAEGFSAAKAIENINKFLSGGELVPAPKLGYLSREERIQRRTRRHSGKPSTLANWAQQMASRWAGEPLSPLLQRSSRRRSVVYLRVSPDKMENPSPIGRLKTFPNIKMVTLAHDVIPVDHPEYVRPKSTEVCAARIRTMARYSDGIIATSRYVADRLAPWLGPQPPLLTISHIGMDTTGGSRMSELPDLVRTPYFLIISTIEARKNHLLLLNIWQRLVAEFGDAAPKLIIAGKRGWEAQTTLAMLDRARALDRHVYEAGAVPDEALDVLRRNATALLMPSFVEGFGMPVTEALAVDTPVIASDIPVFREVVGDAAELIDPTDGPAWRAAILDYAAPDSPRRAAALARAQRFAAPTWQSHFARVAPFLEEVIGETRPSLSQKAREALRKVSFEPAPDRGRLMPRH